VAADTDAKSYRWIFPSDDTVDTRVVEVLPEADGGNAIRSVAKAFTLVIYVNVAVWDAMVISTG
jgi:hypothetical protein